VVGDEQVAPVMAQAQVGRLVAQADLLPQRRQPASGRVDGEGTGPPHWVRLARAIFIRCIKAVVLQVQRQPRRVGSDQRLQGAWLDPTAFRIEAQAQDAWTAAVMRSEEHTSEL